ncbi:MAG: TetR/AcrR family transcriptional regulator [Saprospiraceae bacterium]|nr:TetR/AcrR family transcriptional regulator [Saprospiraceae bacterium]
MSRKNDILDSALSLFAEYGFHAVSTARIARDAHVSEALIFRHFKSKRGLLTAILQDVENRIATVFMEVMQEEDPRSTIEKFIYTVFDIDESEHQFWTLSFKVKWDQDFYKPEEMKPILEKLTWAFGELGREHPEIEADMLQQNIESIAIKVLREGKEGQLKYRDHLIRKYLESQ